MRVRAISQKAKSGNIRKYMQIVRSYRRTDGMPATKVVAHLGPYDPVLFENLARAFTASRMGQCLELKQDSECGYVEARVRKNLTYLPVAVVSRFFRSFGLDVMLDGLLPKPPRAAGGAAVIEALVVHRCDEPGSKRAFQEWLKQAAIAEVIGVDGERINNSRVHRVMNELAAVDEKLQERIEEKIVANDVPLLLYFDLTDTWFEAGGGTLARRGKTKQGHRSKKKIHIALLVNEKGLPMRWRLLPGALSETTVLPSWLDYLSNRTNLKQAVLIFDRGMPCAENFLKLVGNGKLDGQDGGRLFLTSVKSDAIPTYVELDKDALDALQALAGEANAEDVATACAALELHHLRQQTYARDLGVVNPPMPKTKRRVRPPSMHGYLYFNREIQQTKRAGRQEKIDKAHRFVAELNENLRQARQPRKPDTTRRKVISLLEKLKLLEIFDVQVETIRVKIKTKDIDSQQIKLKLRDDMLRNTRRYDGITLLVGHPKLEMTVGCAISSYRQKNVVEADFRTIKSVLNLRPTFHSLDLKIQSHVTFCVLALLVERLIEEKLVQSALSQNSRPQSADAMLRELSSVELNRLVIQGQDFTTRTEAGGRIRQLLNAIGAEDILSDFPATARVPFSTL